MSIKSMPKCVRTLIREIKRHEKNCGTEVAGNGYTYHVKRFGNDISVQIENDSMELVNEFFVA